MEVVECVIRSMKREEVNIVKEWVKSWNEGEEYLHFLFDLKSSTFYAAEYNGEIAGCCLSVALDDNNVFGAMLIVKEELRGKGIGTKLRLHRLKDIGNRNFTINSIEALLASNLKLETKFKESFLRTATYQGNLNRAMLEPCNVSIHDSNFVRINDTMMQKIIEYDASMNTIPRPDYLRMYLKQEKAITYVAVQETTREIMGFGTLWPAEKGYKLNPLYANTPEIAGVLLYNLAQELADADFLEITIPRGNRAAYALVKQLALQKKFSCIRIYTKSDAIVPEQNIFSLSSLEAALA